MMTPKQAARRIKSLKLTPGEIRSLFDELGSSDEIIDAVILVYSKKLNDPSFCQVADIIDEVDICVADEKIISSRMDSVLLKNFINLFKTLMLSRSEIVYFVKNDFVCDDDIIISFNETKSQDLMDVISRWKPSIIPKISSKIDEYGFSRSRILKFSKRMTGGIKFKFLSGDDHE